MNSGVSIYGTIDELKNRSLKVKEGEYGIFKVEGECRKGKIVLRKMNVLPIIYRKKYIGDIIL